jgi:phage FluMu gp28-like protein
MGQWVDQVTRTRTMSENEKSRDRQRDARQRGDFWVFYMHADRAEMARLVRGQRRKGAVGR